MMSPMDVRIGLDDKDVGRQAAAAAALIMRQAVRDRARCTLALSGGRTPMPFYAQLAVDSTIEWPAVHVFWSDERYVPVSDPASNQAAARDALLDRVVCPAANVHPVRTDLPDPDEAARDYERRIRDVFGSGQPAFDLLVLGMGSDGHIASIFPASPALAEAERWVTAAMAPGAPRVRVTFTLPLILQARAIFVIVTGASKSAALRRVLTMPPDGIALPAARLRGASGAVTWWIDAPAAHAAGLGIQA